MLSTSETIKRGARRATGGPLQSKEDFNHDEDHVPKPKNHQVRYQKRKAAGLCTAGGCRAKAEPAHTHCRKHLQEMSEHNKRMYAERNREGLCIYCGERPPFWGVRCIICRQKFAKHPLPFGARRALRLYREAERRRELELSQAQTRFHIRKLLAAGDITGKSAEALRLYAGVDDNIWRSCSEVGELMRLSKERVRLLLLASKIPLINILGDEVSRKLPQAGP